MDNIASQLSGPSDRRAGPEPLPLAVAGEDVPRYSALPRPGVLMGRVPDHHRDRRLRDLVHRPLSALIVRLQRRRGALELAGRVLRVRRLGTDRYPPFTLVRTEYPADFDVAYPERLSRGLVLVKWLLAIPHLIIIGLIVADLLPYPWTSNDWSSGLQPIGGYSVLNLLVVLAGFFLLITRQYPRALFDLLVGIN